MLIKAVQKNEDNGEIAKILDELEVPKLKEYLLSKGIRHPLAKILSHHNAYILGRSLDVFKHVRFGEYDKVNSSEYYALKLYHKIESDLKFAKANSPG